MDVAGEEQAEQLIARCRLTEAAARLAAMRYDDGGDPEGSRKRLCAGVYALFGDDRNLAGTVASRVARISQRGRRRLVLRIAAGRAGFARLSRGRGRALLGDRCRRDLRPLPPRVRSRGRREALPFRGGRARAPGAPCRAFRRNRRRKGRARRCDAPRGAAIVSSSGSSRAAAAAARLALDSGDIERAVQLVASPRGRARISEEISPCWPPRGCGQAVAPATKNLVARMDLLGDCGGRAAVNDSRKRDRRNGRPPGAGRRRLPIHGGRDGARCAVRSFCKPRG